MGVVTPRAWGGRTATPSAASPVVAGASLDGGTLSVTFPAVSVIEDDDLGASYLGTGGHTLYGAAVPISQTHYWWFTVDGVGADPELAGMTGVEVELTGSGPFTGAAVATLAVSTAASLGYTMDRTDEVVEISGNGLNAAAAVAVADGLTTFTARGGGRTLGAEDTNGGSNTAGNSTGWIQVLPANVPSGTFRVIGFEIFRGNNVTNPVRMYLASGGAGDGDPETAVVDIDRAMGNSGTNQLHREWLDHDEIVEYSGGDRLFIGVHGDGSSSSIIGGGSINNGMFFDGGGDNLWLTDGTTGSANPPASPVGAITTSFNFGIAVRIIIQEAPYQDDGAYRVIAGAVPGRDDQDLFPAGTETEDILVGWGITVPNLTDIALFDTQLRFQAHASGDANQKRLELWNVGGGGSTTFVGDTLVSHIGTTQDDQGTGWSSVQSVAPISLTPGGDYRYTIKGTLSTGVIFDVDVGGAGLDANTPTYALGDTTPRAFPRASGALEDEEVEVQGHSQGGDETTIYFDPQTATASPNAADGTIVYPGNIGMIALYIGTPGPVVAEL